MARREKSQRKDEKLRAELKPLGSRVMDLRELTGATHKAVAAAGGISEAQVQRIETARDNPKYLTLQALARGLGVDPGAILSDNYPPNVPLVRRQPPGSWKLLEEAARFLQALAAEMAAYEAAMVKAPPRTASAKSGARRGKRRHRGDT
jgi:transcriptional regulator with XRE-family HTH domain